MSVGPAWLATWLALPLLGAPLLAHRAYGRIARPARLVLAGAAGAVLLSFVMTLWALVGARWSVLPVALAAAGLSGALGLAIGGGPTIPSDGRSPVLPALVSGAAVTAALLATLSGAAGSSDLLFFWGPKAKAFAAARTIDADFLASRGASHMHAYYPPLVTNVDALATMVAGQFAWRSAALTFPLLLAALAIALPTLLRQAERRFAPEAISALLVSSFALLGAAANIAGNADAPLFAFEILGLALLLAPAPIEGPALLLAGILFAGAATAKVEGLPFVLAATLFFVADRRNATRRTQATALLFAPTVLSLSAWFLFGFSRGVFTRYGEYGSPLDIRWDRLGLVLREIGRTVGSGGLALSFLIPLAVLLANHGGFRRLPILVSAALALFLVVTYMLPVSNPTEWIHWSAARTLAPIAGLLALAVAGAARRGQAKRTAIAMSEKPEIQSPATKDRGQ